MLLVADPKADFLANADAIRAAIARVLESGHYILGPEGESFEKEFSVYQGGGYTVGVANGTDALELALRAAGVGPGDGVATVANTVTATVCAISEIGARPVFVEIDAATMVMSPEALAGAFSREKIKAVVPVHLYGFPVNMTRMVEIASANGAVVVEDCAQAHGAMIGTQKTGTWGAMAAFSFYPTKNLGALGDGGAVFTRDAAYAEKVRSLRQYGWRTRYVAESPGRNSRLDEIQAAILRVKLPQLDAGNEKRRKLASRYLERLRSAPLLLPATVPGTTPVFHQFTVRTARRDWLREALLQKGIQCGVLYPVPIHHQPAYRNAELSLPVTEQACAEVLCLPCHPALTEKDVDEVSAAIIACLR
ncbi:MAG: DegT/DnrJ/EryC1/StrS family aminotransferase [Opitutaceae bacterium]